MIGRSFSFRSKLRLTLGLLVGAIVALMTVFFDFVASSGLLEAQRRELTQAAAQMADRLDQDMASSLREVLSLAGGSMLSAATVGDPLLAKPRLDTTKRLFANFAWIGLTDKNGRVIVASDNHLVGWDVSNRPWFEQGKKTPVAIDVHDAVLLQKLLDPRGVEPLRFVDLAAPVLTPDGQFGGTLCIHLSWKWAEELQTSILASIQELQGVQILVLSRANEVLLGPRSLVGTTIDPASLQGEYITAVVKTSGYREYGGLGWSVVARQSTAAAFAPIYVFRATSLAGIVLIALLFVAVADRIARSVARPLEQLAENAETLRTNPDATLQPSGASFQEAVRLEQSLTGAFKALQERDVSLRSLNADLERKIDERTHALQRAKDEAESAARAKTEFLATISHEIRSPLGSILGLANLMFREGEIDDKSRHRLRIIQTASGAMATLVNDILDLSKVESGTFQIVTKAFHLVRLLETCAELMATQAEAKGITLRVDLDASLPGTVLGDEHRIRQVLINLLGNAIKFTRSGAVELRARQREGKVEIAIIDTGIGIPQDKIESLFTRYMQADRSIQQEFGGTGLGLAISQRLVNLMGGIISVTSRVGNGSTFAFSLVLPEAELPVGNGEDEEAPPAIRPLKILLADDLSANLEIATAILAGAGHRIECVADGGAALQAASAQPYDIILLDIQMPKMSGLDVTKTLRREAGPNRETPIIALTADVLPAHLERFRQGGMNAHVGKPFARGELLSAVAALIGGSEAEARPEPAADTFSRARFDEIVELLGRERADGYLADLSNRLGHDWPAIASDAGAEFAATAHKLVGLAGMLGFGALADRCRQLEEVYDAGGDLTDMVGKVTDDARAALDLATSLMAAGSTVEAGESGGPGAPSASEPTSIAIGA